MFVRQSWFGPFESCVLVAALTDTMPAIQVVRVAAVGSSQFSSAIAMLASCYRLPS
jgi:hypothetical protein